MQDVTDDGSSLFPAYGRPPPLPPSSSSSISATGPFGGNNIGGGGGVGAGGAGGAGGGIVPMMAVPSFYASATSSQPPAAVAAAGAHHPRNRGDGDEPSESDIAATRFNNKLAGEFNDEDLKELLKMNLCNPAMYPNATKEEKNAMKKHKKLAAQLIILHLQRTEQRHIYFDGMYYYEQESKTDPETMKITLPQVAEAYTRWRRSVQNPPSDDILKREMASLIQFIVRFVCPEGEKTERKLVARKSPPKSMLISTLLSGVFQ